MAAKVGQHVGVLAQLEAIDGGIAGDAPGPLPIVNDLELARLLEEGRDVVDDDDVDVEKKGGALEAMQIGFRRAVPGRGSAGIALRRECLRCDRSGRRTRNRRASGGAPCHRGG
jgi:hypothetical protein